MEQNESCRFRSDFYHDLKLHTEFLRGSRDGRLFYRFIYLYIIAILLWFYWYMVLHLEAPEDYANSALFICFILVLVEFFWWLLNRGGGVHFKRSLMLNGGKPTHDSVLFCEDHILTLEQESGNRATIAYHNIRSVMETENLLLLTLRFSTCLIVDKRCLTGTREELGQFLYEKCPKLRHKKVRTTRWGVLLRRIAWAVVAVTFLLGLWYQPMLQLNRRFRGQIHNGMTLTEIADELETYGIGSLPEQELTGSDNGLFYLGSSKLEHLLYVLGIGERDYDTGRFTPAETGVFFSYYWSDNPETMYTDFLRGICAMSKGAITAENIREDHTNTDWNAWDGTVTVDFTLNGNNRHLDAVFYGEWYDEQVFNAINKMVLEATGKQLYFADFEDTACFVFLFDEVQAQMFAKRSGLEISTDINDIY